MKLIEDLIAENHLEKVLASNLPQEIKQDWQDFFEEYEQKKDTAYIDSVEKLLALSKEETEKVLYIELEEVNQETIDALYAYKAIKVLILSGRKESLQVDIGKFTKLRIAIIQLIKPIFTDNFEQCKNLYFLDISWNNLQSLPNWIANLVNLQQLNCLTNELQSLPDWIGNLTNLQQLNCSTNRLRTLPKSFGNLTNLQELDCHSNKLQILPDSFGNLANLKKLACWQNQLTILPDSFGNLVNLQELDCWQNQLQILPESFGNLTNLQELNCSDNQLQILPESFGNLVNLKELNFSKNQLQILPESFENLVNLKELNSSKNQLQSLPENFGNLANLQELYCGNNQLQSLPETCGNLANLQQFHCYSNQLQTLPFSFANLRDKLQYFSYSENPCTEMPEIIDMGLGRLMDYLDEKRGRKPYKLLWKMSKELHKTLQKYLVGFQDFVFTLSGKEIKLEVHRQTEGLELVIEPRELSMTEIDDYLALYVGDKLEIDFEALKSKFSLTELFEAKRFLEEHKREKERLLYDLRYLKDKCELIEGRNKELWITITFFQNQSEQHLEIILNQQKQLEIKQTTVNANPNLGLMLPAGFQQNGLRKIKIFLASSAELKDVRMALRDFLSTENDKYTEYGIYFEIVQWEFVGESISAVSKQGDYNEKLKGCEVFLGLFWTKVGKYTEEEFNVAYAQFKAGEQPSVLYTYFKTLTDEIQLKTQKTDLLSLWNFENKLHNEIKHFKSNFTEINDLKVQLKHQIEIEILPKLLNQKV